MNSNSNSNSICAADQQPISHQGPYFRIERDTYCRDHASSAFSNMWSDTKDFVVKRFEEAKEVVPDWDDSLALQNLQAGYVDSANSFRVQQFGMAITKFNQAKAAAFAAAAKAVVGLARDEAKKHQEIAVNTGLDKSLQDAAQELSSGPRLQTSRAAQILSRSFEWVKQARRLGNIQVLEVPSVDEVFNRSAQAPANGVADQVESSSAELPTDLDGLIGKQLEIEAQLTNLATEGENVGLNEALSSREKAGRFAQIAQDEEFLKDELGRVNEAIKAAEAAQEAIHEPEPEPVAATVGSSSVDETKECPQCHTANPEKAKICMECGNAFPQPEPEPTPVLASEKECPNCHVQVPANARFCTDCGHNFQPAEVANGAQAPDAASEPASDFAAEGSVPLAVAE